MTETQTAAPKKHRNEIRHGSRVGCCRVRSSFFEIQVGTKKQKKQKKNKGKSVAIEEPSYERFYLQAPHGYLMEPLRKEMTEAFNRVVLGTVNKVELVLDRFPQVNTVMGELIASVPKTKRPSFGYTNKDESNTLFVIERK